MVGPRVIIFTMLVLTMVVYSAAAAATSPWLSPAQLAAAADSSGAETAPVSVMELLAALEGSDDRRLQEIPIIDVSAQQQGQEQGQDQEPGQFQHRRFRHEASAVRILYQIGVSIIMCIGRGVSVKKPCTGQRVRGRTSYAYTTNGRIASLDRFSDARNVPPQAALAVQDGRSIVHSALTKGTGGNFPVAPDVSRTRTYVSGAIHVEHHSDKYIHTTYAARVIGVFMTLSRTGATHYTRVRTEREHSHSRPEYGPLRTHACISIIIIIIIVRIIINQIGGRQFEQAGLTGSCVFCAPVTYARV